jgi:hypothetical protein
MSEDNRIEVYANSKPADPAALKPGDVVTIYLIDGTSVQARVEAREDHLSHDLSVKLTAINPDYVVDRDQSQR